MIDNSSDEVCKNEIEVANSFQVFDLVTLLHCYFTDVFLKLKNKKKKHFESHLKVSI